MEPMIAKRFPCPCCGYKVYSEPPGSYEICPICGWEDDVSQLRFPELRGANELSLVAAQRNFATFGASSRLKAGLRAPNYHDEKDSEWRPIEAGDILDFKNVSELATGKDDKLSLYPSDYTQLYYWKPVATIK